MKRVAFIVSIGMLLLSCNPNNVKKPEKLIEKEEMVSILYDLYIANAMYSTDSKYFADHNMTPAKFVYQKYKIDSLQFAQNDYYYASDVENYEKLFKTVTEKLQKNKALIDTIIANSATTEVKAPKERVITSPSQVQDSLRKTRLFKKNLDK